MRTPAVPRPLQDVLDHRVGGPALRGGAVLALYVVAIEVFFQPPSGVVFNGLTNGMLYGLLGVGVLLIYRTNRIINFAAAGLGAVPGVLAALLVAKQGWSWYVCFPMALILGVVLGALIDVLVIRRFSNAPRLILTVATIGVSQVLAFFALWIPIWMGSAGRPITLITPFNSTRFTIGNQIFTGDFPFTIGLVALAVTGLALFLRYTRMGIALRASAENADRASLLGIPVRQVQTVSWMLASLLASIAIFQRASIVAVPTDGSLGPKVLLFALSAAVIARMESIPICLAAGAAIGVLGEAIVVKTGKDSLTAAIMLGVLLVVLFLQRNRLARAYDTGVSTWQSVKEFKPVPPELRRVREVVVAKWAVAALALGFFAVFPYLAGDSRIGYVHLVVITAIIAVSLVILTGWAGQISLGQYGIVGIGAAVGGKLAAEHNVDFFVALVAGALAGALVAVLIGLPALRIQGLYLAVTTLAFGAAMQFYFLDDSYRVGRWLMPERGSDVAIPVLWERVKLTNELGVAGLGFYYFTLVILGLVLLMARAYRRNRAGRAVVAVRENQRAASSYSVNPALTKLGAFAVSGAIAAVAGVMLAYQNGSVDAATYGIGRSLDVFVITVIGGLTSLTGAVFGAVVLESVKYLGRDLVQHLDLLVTGPGLLLILLLLPGGFAEGLYRIRDAFLRWVANRRQIHVPSLVADRRVDIAEELSVIEDAEQRVEELERVEVGAGAGEGR